MNRTIELPDYPVAALQASITEQLERNLVPVLKAPPGSGKSTLVPFFPLEESWRGNGTVLLLQPRRAAVRSLAARLRHLSGGRYSVGHITRYEHSVPNSPAIIVMTEGIFTRKLLDDPELGGVAAVLFDEFHERSLATDLAYVLGLQCRELFRPDLRLAVMSATLDTERFDGEEFTLLEAEGTLHPVSVEHRPVPARAAVEQHGAEVCRSRLFDGEEGSILFFLPGEAEIHRAARNLTDGTVPEDVDIYPLYGRLSPEEQSRAIAPSPRGRRKVVIATNIAETSLTIEGISCVIDSGLRRRAGSDPDTGLPRLETVRISAASAKQRAGRAGRMGPGRIIRLWEQGERLEAFDEPEIKRSDLAGLFLTLAAWGDSDGSSCRWPDPPPSERQREAHCLLRDLGALDEKGVPTAKGARMARIPVNPRLAAMLADISERIRFQNAALTAALLEHGDPLRPDLREQYGADLDLRVDLLKRARQGDKPAELSGGAVQRILREAERLDRLVFGTGSTDGTAGNGDPAGRSGVRVSAGRSGAEDHESRGVAGATEQYTVGTQLLAAYPDRIAMRTERGRYLLPSGVEAVLIEGERGFAPEWIAAGALHRRQREALIYLAAALHEDEVRSFINARGDTEEHLEADENGNLRARRIKSLGALRVSSTPIPPGKLSDPRRACIRLIRERGLGVLEFGRNAARLRSRIAFLRSNLGAPWPAVDEETLLERLDEWLLPFLPRSLRKSSLREVPLADALRSLVPWEFQQKLDELAPDTLTLPSGTRRRLRYEEGRCVLSARVQQLFGLRDTPRAAGVPVEIELLSPAGRPVQVTTDLRSFWERTYPEVRRELRGRYPKHHWPEDPFSAEPTDRVRPEAR
jgi:ATP-dependent helicase HrpB